MYDAEEKKHFRESGICYAGIWHATTARSRPVALNLKYGWRRSTRNGVFAIPAARRAKHPSNVYYFFGIILSRIERAGLLGWLLGTSGAKVCHNDLLLMKATHHYGVSEVPSIAYNQLGLLMGHAVLRAAGASNNLLGPSRLTQRMAEQRAGMEQKRKLAIPTFVRWLFFAIRRFGCVFHRWVLPRPSPRWLHVGLQGRPAGAGNLSSLLACSSLY